MVQPGRPSGGEEADDHAACPRQPQLSGAFPYVHRPADRAGAAGGGHPRDDVEEPEVRADQSVGGVPRDQLERGRLGGHLAECQQEGAGREREQEQHDVRPSHGLVLGHVEQEQQRGEEGQPHDGQAGRDPGGRAALGPYQPRHAQLEGEAGQGSDHRYDRRGRGRARHVLRRVHEQQVHLVLQRRQGRHGEGEGQEVPVAQDVETAAEDRAVAAPALGPADAGVGRQHEELKHRHRGQHDRGGDRRRPEVDHAQRAAQGEADQPAGGGEDVEHGEDLGPAVRRGRLCRAGAHGRIEHGPGDAGEDGGGEHRADVVHDGEQREAGQTQETADRDDPVAPDPVGGGAPEHHQALMTQLDGAQDRSHGCRGHAEAAAEVTGEEGEQQEGPDVDAELVHHQEPDGRREAADRAESVHGASLRTARRTGPVRREVRAYAIHHREWHVSLDSDCADIYPIERRGSYGRTIRWSDARARAHRNHPEW